jgi:hypothetical protein
MTNKSIRTYFLILLLTMLTATFSNAQERISPEIQGREISESEFRALETKGFDRLRGHSHRKKTASLAEPVLGQVVSEIVAYTPPDKYQTMTIWKIENGTKREETIRIGSRLFSRVGNDGWKEAKLSADESPVFGNPTKSDESSTFRFILTESIGDIVCDVFERMNTIRFHLPNQVAVLEDTRRYWVTRDGSFVKMEVKSTMNKQVRLHQVSTYTYDQNIKIEPPSTKL